MPCGNCRGSSKVIDSRLVLGRIRRRRECLDCQSRFTTYEYAAGDPDLDGLSSVRDLLIRIEGEARDGILKVREIIRGD